MAPLGARRLAEMVGLGERIVAIELLVAAQAVELRGSGPLGRGTRRVFELVRERTPFVGSGDALPADLDELVELIRSEVVLGSSCDSRWTMAPVPPDVGADVVFPARESTY